MLERSERRRGAREGFFAALAIVGLTGCGLAVQAPDLFLVTRTGAGKPLTMVVNYEGAVTCDRRAAKTLPGKLLLVARSLPGQLESDANKKIDPPSPPGSVYRFKVSLQYGTFSFPDTSAAHRPELAKLEQFVFQAAPICGAGG